MRCKFSYEVCLGLALVESKGEGRVGERSVGVNNADDIEAGEKSGLPMLPVELELREVSKFKESDGF